MNHRHLFAFYLATVVCCVPVIASEPQREKLDSKEIILESEIDKTQVTIDQSWLPFGKGYESMRENKNGIHTLPYNGLVLQLIAKALHFTATSTTRINREKSTFFFTDEYSTQEAVNSFYADPESVSSAYDALQYFELKVFQKAFIKNIVQKVQEEADKEGKEIFFDSIPQAKGISFKELTKIKSDLEGYFQYDYIRLDNLGLDSLEGIKDFTESIKYNPLDVENISLNENAFTSLDQDTYDFINECKKLRNLSLSNNQLEELPPDFLSKQKSIRGLHLSYNKLRYLPNPFLPAAIGLHVLWLDNNQLEDLPFHFLNSQCNELQRIKVNQNPRLPFDTLMNRGKISHAIIKGSCYD